MQGILCNQFISDGTVANKERQEMLFYLKVVWSKYIKVWEANNLMVLQENAQIC